MTQTDRPESAGGPTEAAAATDTQEPGTGTDAAAETSAKATDPTDPAGATDTKDATEGAPETATSETLDPAVVAGGPDTGAASEDAGAGKAAGDAATPEAAGGSDDTTPPADGTAKAAGAKGPLIPALAGAGAVLVVVGLVALAAFVWPGFAAGPGAPDDEAAKATTALTGKDAAALDALSCRGPDGKPVNQFPAEAFQLIQSTKTTGPVATEIDTQAKQPIELTIGAQGQTQALPADLMLGVDKGEWCVLGIQLRQQ
jgi:hypothetical protein